MDKTTSGKEKVSEKKEEMKFTPFQVRVAPEKQEEVEKVIKFLEIDFRKRTAGIDKELKSFWSDKIHYKLMKWIAETDHATDLNMWMTLYWLDYIEQRLQNLESIVSGIAKLNLSNMEERIQTLQDTLKEPELANVAKFIHEFNEGIKKAQKAQEDYVK